ncbi:MAG: PIG-L family deacetylase [Singulisphaera sp.]
MTSAGRRSTPPTCLAGSAPNPTCSDRGGCRGRPRRRHPAGALPVAPPGRRRVLVRGTLAALRRSGWRIAMATAFTASVDAPTGFALACQLDKGLAADVDYMALRREEDAAFARALGVDPVEWLGLPEAPHRGYNSAPALFGGVRPDDEIWREVASALDRLDRRWRPAAVFAPQAIGGHVDHLQAVRAVLSLPAIAGRTAWYRDLPYAARFPDARPSPTLPGDLIEARVGLAEADLAAKLDGCACYATQVGFQFGGVAAMRDRLGAFAMSEAGRSTAGVAYAETFLAPRRVAAALAAIGETRKLRHGSCGTESPV